MTTYRVIQCFDGDSSGDIRRTFNDIATAREAFANAVATQKTGNVTLLGQPNDEPEDFTRLNNMPEVLDYHDFDGPR